MYRMVKASYDSLPGLASLDWENGENEGVVAKADAGDAYYGLVCEWMDVLESDPEYPNQYCAMVVVASKEDVMQMIANEHNCDVSDLPDQVGEEYDYFWDCEDYFLHNVTNSNVVETIGWYKTYEDGAEASKSVIGV